MWQCSDGGRIPVTPYSDGRILMTPRSGVKGYL
jgi:hypothetical protein